MSKEKLARRKAAGDDPTAKSQSNSSMAGAPPAQPNPMMPQGRGNLMNNPMNGMSMGGGAPQPGGPGLYPYMDGGIGPGDARNGTVGYAPPSGKPQAMVSGRGFNTDPYFTQAQPMGETQNMMEPMYLAQQAGERSAKHYGQEQQPPYQISPMGMSGFDLDTAQKAGYVNPGQIPGNAPAQMFDTLGLQGMNDAQMAATLGMGPSDGSEMRPGSTPQKIQKKKGGKK